MPKYLIPIDRLRITPFTEGDLEDSDDTHFIDIYSPQLGQMFDHLAGESYDACRQILAVLLADIKITAEGGEVHQLHLECEEITDPFLRHVAVQAHRLVGMQVGACCRTSPDEPHQDHIIEALSIATVSLCWCTAGRAAQAFESAITNLTNMQREDPPCPSTDPEA